MAWLGSHAILILACVLVVAPIYFLVLGSFKSVEEFFAAPFGLPQHFGLRQLPARLDRGIDLDDDQEQRHRDRVRRPHQHGRLVPCELLDRAAPAPGPLFWRLLFVGGLIVPVQLIMVAIFITMRWIGLLGTLGSLILVYSTFGIPLGVLVLVGFFQALPKELTEAATIDGASDFQTFMRVILPLSMAPILTVMILNGVWIWNDFFIALVLSTKPSVETLPLGILNFFGVYSTEWGLIFASVVLSALPVVALYLLMTRRFIAGMTAGSVKG